MGLYVHRSNRVEHLAVDLAAQIRLSASEDPMVPVRIVVGSRGMERWLRHALAEQLGVCAQVRFGFPSAVLDELVAAALGDVELAPATFWSPEVLAFALLRALPSLEGEDLAPLGRYLGPSAAPPFDRRAFGLARSLADVFDRYLLYRPELVRAFEAGALPRDLIRDPDARLEARLFRALAALGGEPHFVARAAELDRRAAPARPLPARIHLFGLSSVPPAHLHVLASLARFMGVDLYVLCPSDRYWGDLRTAREAHAALEAESREAVAEALLEHLGRQSPLLTSLGRTSRDFQLVLEALPYGYEDAELFTDPRALARAEGRSPTLLEGLQSDVLGLVSKADLREDPARAAEREVAGCDDSFRVHACAGASRQVEALRDVLLGLFDDHPTLEARDVLVMTPDVETYAPLVTAVFDGDGPGGARPTLRVQVSDRAVFASNAFADALVRLFDLVEGRITAAAALDLLGLSVVRGRFGIDEAELPALRAWARESGMRWAIDEHDRAREGQPRARQNTLRFGLERIALGAVADDDALALGALSVGDLGGAEGALLAGRFLAFAETLFEHREALRAPGTVSAFARRTRAALAALTSAEDDAGGAAEEVYEALASIEAEAEAAGFEAELTIDGFRRAIEGRLEGGRGGDRPIASAITLCALTPMRSVPFPVICLLGMDDGAFPRPASAPGFDLAAREPRVGDRDPRDEDRHLLLEALLSARRHLRIFYTGRDPRSGEARAAAVPVAELLGFIESTYAAGPGDSLREQLVIEHPLQPFSPGEHLPRLPDPRAPGRRLPMAFDPRMLEAARRLASPRVSRVGPLAGCELEPLAVSRVELPELVDFLRMPVRHLLRRRLGLVLESGDAGLEAREPLELDGLERFVFERELLARAFDAATARGGAARVDWEALAGLVQASGSLPPGTPGRLVLERAVTSARALLEAAAARTPKPLRELPFEHHIGRVAFEGVLHVAEGRELLAVGHEPVDKPRRLLEAWVGLLALQAGTDAPCAARVLGVAKGDVEERTLELGSGPGGRRERARALLADLLALRDEGLARPLLLFEKTSFAVASRLASKSGARPEALFGAAMSAWSGAYAARGEADEPFVALAFPEASPPFARGGSLAPEFVALAQRVYGPLLESARGIEGAGR